MSTTAANVVSTQDTKTALDTTTLAASEKRRPQKLSDFPEDVQALMPVEWERSWDICSGVVPADKRGGSYLNPKNYFLWAIQNNAELARRMIVHRVDPDAKEGEIGRESPLYVALYMVKDHTLVEYLCMAGAKLDITLGSSSTWNCTSNIKRMYEDGRSLIGWLYEDSRTTALNPAQQAFLFHVWGATAPKEVETRLMTINHINSYLPVKEIFQIVCAYILNVDFALKSHLRKANFQIDRFSLRASKTSLVEQFHALARAYFEKPSETQTKDNMAAANQNPLIFRSNPSTENTTDNIRYLELEGGVKIRAEL